MKSTRNFAQHVNRSASPAHVMMRDKQSNSGGCARDGMLNWSSALVARPMRRQVIVLYDRIVSCRVDVKSRCPLALSRVHLASNSALG